MVEFPLLMPQEESRENHDLVLQNELCPPTPTSNSYVEALTSDVTVFGNRAYKKVSKVT